MAESSPIEQDLIAFIAARIVGEPVGPKTDLIGTGILDSMLVVDLLTHVEKTYRASIESADITPAVFQNVASLAALISQRRPGLKAA